MELPVIGVEHAPNLISHLENSGVDIVDSPEDPQASILNGEEDIVLVIPENYGERFIANEPALVEMIIDESRIPSRRKSGQLKSIINAYSQNIVSKRLIARGISPSVIQPIVVNSQDLATPETKGASLFEMVIMFGVMAAFLCNMYIAIDTSAGERERGSLEPLLLSPVRRSFLVVGKWIATIVFGAFGVLLTLVVAALVLKQVPFEVLGLRLLLGVQEVLHIFVCFLPLVLLAGAMQLFLSSFAKSFKEAQTYLSLVLFLPMVPGMYLMFKPTNPDLWMAAIPALGQQVYAGSILRGSSLGSDFILLCSGSSLALTGVFLWLTIRLFKSESFFMK